MTTTRRTTPPDPRTSNQPMPDVSARQNTRDKIRSYNLGYQDGVNTTANMRGDQAGRRALGELLKGDEKPYRRLAARRNPLG